MALSLCFGVTVKAGQVVNSKVGKKDTTKPNNRKYGKSFSPTAPDHTRMEHSGVDEPRNEGPGFFGIPTPIAPPGGVGPNGAGNDSQGKKKKPNNYHLICEIIQYPRPGKAFHEEVFFF